MRTRIISTLAAATLALSACGGGGASGAQGEAADALAESAEAEGLDIDKGCVEDLAKKLSDADAEKLAAAGADDDPELSPEGEALQFELFDCVDIDSYVDLLVEDMGDEVDADCLKDALEDMDLSKGEEALTGALFECVDFGG
jgi:hypothetical protein